MCGAVRRLEARPGPAATHGHCSLALWTLGGAACVAVILGRSATRCYKRRQSDGFFAENQGFWTQIDDVCNMSTRKEVQTAPV